MNVTEGFLCFFLSCKTNARVKPAKTGHRPHSSKFLCCSMYFCVVLCIVCFVSFSVLFVCICVLYYCHRVATQLQLNIYHIISYHIVSYHIISYHIISYHTISYHMFSVLFVCKCVLYYCHRVAIQLQLNIYHIISYHIISYHIISHHIISYHIISYHTISYHIILYQTQIHY